MDDITKHYLTSHMYLRFVQRKWFSIVSMDIHGRTGLLKSFKNNTVASAMY